MVVEFDVFWHFIELFVEINDFLNYEDNDHCVCFESF